MSMSEPRTIVIYRTSWQRTVAWAETIIAMTALFAIARWIGSTLMEILAFVLSLAFLFAFEAIRRKGMTFSIAEARARLDEIEQEGR